LVIEATEARKRLQSQILDRVPRELRGERPGGGNSINWGLYHVTTHAELALAVLAPTPVNADNPREWGGLEEEEPGWSVDLNPDEVETSALEVLERIIHFVDELPVERLDIRPDFANALKAVGLDSDRFAWLVRMWGDQPASFLVRWPLLGHVGNHIGELVAVRNRLGLSPF
jgi:hypothetical protein